MMIKNHGDIKAESGGLSLAPARLMCIATHHKAGTVWIKRVIKSLSHAIDVPWIGIWSERQMAKVPASGRAFVCNWSGMFPDGLWASVETAFLHVIRDPRDVLLSGCSYHQTAGIKGEKFLHLAREDLDGRTYQEHLNSIGDTKEKLLFEMENKHAQTLSEMRVWPYGDPRCIELRYEDLMVDTHCNAMRLAFGRLGLQGGEIDAGVQAFWDNSLFGGLADRRDHNGRLKDHVRSGGQLQRWKSEMPRSVGQVYADRYGDDLIALGYEKNTSWVDRLVA